MADRDSTREPEVNGILESHRSALKAKLSDAREVQSFSGPWNAKVTWDGGFRTHAEVRGHRISFDEPADLAADDSAPTPHEHLLSAVGACITTGVVLHATILGITLHHVDVSVSGTFDNILKWAGIHQDGNPGYQSLELAAAIHGDAPEDVLQGIWDRAVEGSPVAQTIQRATQVVTLVQVHPGRSDAADAD